MKAALVLAAVLAAASSGCVANPGPNRDPDLGRPLLRLRWRVVTSDRAREMKPQEFASIARVGDHVYTGSAGGRFFSLDALDGKVRWQEKVGSVSSLRNRCSRLPRAPRTRRPLPVTAACCSDGRSRHFQRFFRLGSAT